jgi:hypothetical protein
MLLLLLLLTLGSDGWFAKCVRRPPSAEARMLRPRRRENDEGRERRRALPWEPGRQIEVRGGSTSRDRFMKPGKYSHVTWLGGNRAKY